MEMIPGLNLLNLQNLTFNCLSGKKISYFWLLKKLALGEIKYEGSLFMKSQVEEDQKIVICLKKGAELVVVEG